MQKRGSIALLCLAMSLAAEPVWAQHLANPAFQIDYDAGGIRSLKRTGDVADTDYIAANGALGPILIRYRTAARGDWRELRQMLLANAPGDANTMECGGGAAGATAGEGCAPARGGP